MMMRLMLMLVCSLAVAGCNLSDPVDGLPDNNQNNNNENNIKPNNSNNTDPDMSGGNNDTGGELSVTFSDVRINFEPVPTQAPAQTTLEFEADALITGSTGNVQLVVYIDDAPMACLYDGAGDTEADVTGTIEGSNEIETKELLFEAFEEADCDAALAAATGDGEVIGEVEFTAPPPLQVIAVTPATDEENVVVDTTIRVSFNAPIDAGSVAERVQLSNAMGQVPTTINVMNDEIILTPTNPLTEFQTEFTIWVNDGITGGGRALEMPFSSTFRTRMFVPNVFYAAGNEFHGVGTSLGIDAANQAAMTPTDDTAPAQRFRFVPSGDGWVGYNSAAIAAGRALHAGDGSAGVACAMRPLGAMPEPEQIWLFTPTQSPGAFFMGTPLDATQSLDATNNAPSVGAFPLMQPTTDVPRQRWRWRRLPN